MYKYIQIKCTDPSSNISKVIIRGCEQADYHADVLDIEQPGLEALGLKGLSWVKKIQANLSLVRCIGGGRIRKTAKECTVYGYSIGFGRPDHSIAAQAIQEAFPELQVDWNDDGYWLNTVTGAIPITPTYEPTCHMCKERVQDVKESQKCHFQNDSTAASISSIVLMLYRL